MMVHVKQKEVVMLSVWGDTSEGKSFTILLTDTRSPSATTRRVLVFAKDYAGALELARAKAAGTGLELREGSNLN